MLRKEERVETLADTPQMANDLINLVNHPGDIDSATEHLGIPPLLINPHLATPIDLSDLGYGAGIHLPVQISKRRGGRKSLYFMHPGEKILAGLLVTGKALLFRYVSRETGRSIPAQGGDEYVEELRSAGGTLISHLRGRLEIINSKKGEGRLVLHADSPSGQDPLAVKKIKVSYWHLFSCFKGELEIEL